MAGLIPPSMSKAPELGLVRPLASPLVVEREVNWKSFEVSPLELLSVRIGWNSDIEKYYLNPALKCSWEMPPRIQVNRLR